ncbi:unnamed protein product [Rhizoctonia solani]|uniref:Protein-S-isoprenylcysteine O-methyltransferase n=1 Tax=Rhizoctonia solani TaxID=456999 RepID=A0A8H2XH91_9AGAM|nr:unnamed protein product [Rhizoctonia solani]
MYTAGLNLFFTKSQALNGLACASIASSFYFAWPRSDFRKHVEEKAGKAVHMPPGKRGELITAAHGLALLGPTALFLVAIPLNRFVQPSWLAKYALPEVSPPVYYATRIGSSAFIWSSGVIVKKSMKHLDAQWNYIGVRERPEIVKTGPYKVVRHPMYSSIILSMAGVAGVFWNWIPVPALGLLAVIFAIKMPMEENIILRHGEIGPKYAAYKKEVPWRVIPYLCIYTAFIEIMWLCYSGRDTLHCPIANLLTVLIIMYIAGLNLPFTEPQGLNGLACVSLVGSFYLSWPGSDFKKQTEEKAGKAVHMPTGSKGLYITIAHGLALFGPAVFFITVLPLNKFIEPGWLAEYSLPEVSPPAYYGARIGSSISLWFSGLVTIRCFRHLGAQWNYIGVRERPALVRTGPYGVVRHPMYSCAMLMMASMAGALWNWLPLSALGLLSVLFGIKMPMEENVILDHEHLGPKYAVYRKEVPYRVIPYIW